MTPEQLTAAKAALVDRIHTACLTVASMPKAGPRAFFSTWPAHKLEWWDAEDFGSQRTQEAVTRALIQPPRFYPTAKQIDDALPALELLDGGADQRQRRIIRLRAQQLWYGHHVSPCDERYGHLSGGWRGIGALCRCTHTTARTQHAKAISYAFSRLLDRRTSDTQGLSKSLT